MCGIGGFLGSFAPDVLGKMDALIAHRGPDGAGAWHDFSQGIGLMHRRLAIIDPVSSSDQPMEDTTGRALIVFNGEVYNYRELRAELSHRGRQFRTSSDTEVILNAYLEYGVGAFPRFNGMFAFAIWDRRERELVLARDSYGVKPLYLTTTPRGLAFASELKAFLALDDLDRSIDLSAIQRYLTFLYSPGSCTPFRRVSKVDPGCYIVAKQGEPWQQVSFRADPYQQVISHISADESVAQARFFLAQAVERQMVADVPVGAFLSGGLDSSSIVNFARGSSGAFGLECFTIGYESGSSPAEGFSVDLPYAERVAKHLGVRLNTVWVKPDFSDKLDQMVWHLDEPQADPAALNAYFIAKLAREHGVKVLLSGTGGDDLFTGYRRHQALMAEKYWSWLPQIARKSLRWAGELPSKGGHIGRRLSKALQYADQPADRRMAGYFVWLRREVLQGLLSEDVREELRDVDPVEPLLEAIGSMPTHSHPLNRMLNLDFRYFLTDHNLNYNDKMGMAAGVEVRVPFLDPDLVAFAARLPVSYKQNGATGKWVLKQAMTPFLPPDVIHRPKAGFGVPLRDWMRGPLAPKIDEMLSQESLKRRGIFSARSVRRLIDQDRAGQIDAAYPIFELICIETWFRLFVDRQPVPSW